MYQAGAYDIVLADLTLPDSRGLETIERITQSITNTPVVLITGLVNEELALNVIRYGVQDYLVKGLYSALWKNVVVASASRAFLARAAPSGLNFFLTRLQSRMSLQYNQSPKRPECTPDNFR